MSEILIGQAYYLRFDPKLWAEMRPYPPLGALYAAAVLREQGRQVALFDAMLAESEAEWETVIHRTSPAFAVLFEDNFNYLSKMCLLRMRQAAYTMIAAARGQGCTVIAAGADASDHPEQYLRAGAHFVLRGEGEATLAELLDALIDGNAPPVESIPGLAFLDDRARLVLTPPRGDLSNLDHLPFPAWDLADLPRYRRIWIERHGFFSLNMVTGRGCPFHCNWCAKPIWGQRFHVRSPENVVAELKYLVQFCRPDHIWFMDDIFGLKPGWIARFAAELEASELKIPFKCLNRGDLLLREGEVEALQRAGCRTVWIGAESGSQKILDAMEKGTRVDQIQAATRSLRQAGIEVGFFLQFGYPGETLADIEATLRLVRECRPDDIGVSVSYPLPGTKFFRAVEAQLGDRQNWVDSHDLAMLYRGPFSTAFYRQLHTVVHTEFRASRARRTIRQSRPFHLPPQFGKSIARLLFNTTRLPLERWRLRRLARAPHTGLGPFAPTLTPAEAARPTPSEE